MLKEALELYDNGYSLIPDVYGEKRPKIKGWQKLCTERASRDQIEKWFSDDVKSNLAIATGYKVVALDFDNDVDGKWDEIVSLLGDDRLPCKERKNSDGFTLFFKANGEKNRVWRKDGKVVMELLSVGRKTTIPPSMHPSGVEYEWGKASLDNIIDLPTDFEERVDSLFGIDRSLDRVPFVYDGIINDAEIERALTYIHGDDYYTWIEVGMALEQHLGDKGHGLWEKWSSRSANFSNRECTLKWRSFGGGAGGITIGTIFFYAKSAGFTPKFSTEEDGRIGRHSAELSIFNTLKEGDTKKGFPVALLSGDGLVFDIADWINETAIYKQPILALSSAIACVAALKAKLVRSSSYCYTNMYMINVAHSGTGKDHPRKCTEALLHACELPLLVGKEPASGTALVDSIYDSNGAQLLNIDEFGLWLSIVSSEKGAGYQKEIINVIMKMFSQSNGTYMGKAYARQNGKPIESRVIDKPCLSIVGSTTPSALFDSLGSKEAINGFLNRFLIMESEEIDPELNIDGGDTTPPSALVEKIEEVRGGFSREGKEENLLYSKTIEIVYSTKAKEILAEFTTKVNSNRLSEVKDGSDLDAVWVRTREHAIKLALVFSDGLEITGRGMQYGCDLAYYCSLRLIDIVKNRLFDNQWGKDYTYVHEKVKKNKSGISRTKLMQNVCKRMNSKMLDSILQTMLLGNDAIECDIHGGELEHGKAKYYR